MQNPENTNLALHSGSPHLNISIQANSSSSDMERQQQLHQTVLQALEQYQRVYAFRFALYFPADLRRNHFMNDDEIFEHFIESFKGKIVHDRQRALRRHLYREDCCVRFVWGGEGQFDPSHYDVVILINHDAFFALGDFISERNNMFNRLPAAWANAIGLPVATLRELVHIPRNPDCHVSRDDPDSIIAFLNMASHICRTENAESGQSFHGFGASRT